MAVTSWTSVESNLFTPAENLACQTYFSLSFQKYSCIGQLVVSQHSVQTSTFLPIPSLPPTRSGEVIMLNLCHPIYFHGTRLWWAVGCKFLLRMTVLCIYTTIHLWVMAHFANFNLASQTPCVLLFPLITIQEQRHQGKGPGFQKCSAVLGAFASVFGCPALVA